jgi:hypothetical protein
MDSVTARSFARAAACATLFALALAARAGNGSWSNIGPDGGTIYDLEIDPTAPSTMYALAPTGVYKSENGGASWTRSSEGLPGYRVVESELVIDVDQPTTIYRHDKDSVLYRSIDGGANWIEVFRPIYPQRTWSMHDVPGQVGSLLAVTLSNNDHPVHLYRSSDQGQTFTPTGAGLPVGIQIESIAVDPTNPQHILVGMERVDPPQAQPASIFESHDGGATFAPSYYDDPDSGIDAETVSGITFAGGGRVIARTGYKLAVNDSNGASGAWRMTTYFPPTLMRLLFVHPGNRDIVYLPDGQMKRLTIGSTALNPIPVTATTVSTGLSANPTVTSTITGQVNMPGLFRLIGDPTFPASGSRLYVATDGAGIMGTLDGGDGVTSGFSFWSNANLNSGLRGVRISPVAAHPQSPGRLFAGYPNDYPNATPAVYGSTNGGGNWSPLQNGLALAGVNEIAIDPTTTSGPGTTRLYAAGLSMAHGFSSIGLFRSNSGGATWSPLNGDFVASTTPPNYGYGFFDGLREFAFDPRACASLPYNPQGPLCSNGPLTGFLIGGTGRCSGIAPARDCSERLLRSSDGGSTYQALDGNPGFPSSHYFVDAGLLKYIRILSPSAILIDPSNSVRLFVPLASSVNDLNLNDAFSPDTPSGVLYSSDGGATWSARSEGLPRGIAGYSSGTPIYWTHLKTSIVTGAIHPTNGDTLWVAAETASWPTLYKTVNGGLSWTQSSNGLFGALGIIRVITVDSGDPDVIYATGNSSSASSGAVLRSDDGGASWRSISVGLPPIALYSLRIDPFNPARLYAGSDSGVWEMTQVPDDDGDGAPDATENNAPNNGDGNGDAQPDAAQREVGSTVVIFRRGDAQQGIGGFFTSDILTAQSTPTTTGGCAQARDVQARFALEFGRDYVVPLSSRSYRYPRDLSQFEIVDCSQALVDVTYHGADFVGEYGWSFRFYGPDSPGVGLNRWHDFTMRAEKAASNRWRLTLDAMQFGSYLAATDRIMFIGGPACYDDRVFRNSMETVPDTGPPTCDH